MTLIAYHGFGDGARPIFLSDVLVSSKGEPKENVNLPTVGTTDALNLTGVDYAISGLMQKVAIIDRNIAVATAGGSIWCSRFCKDIAEIYHNTTIKNSDEFLDLIKLYLVNEAIHQDVKDIASIFSYIYLDESKQKGISFFLSGGGGAAIKLQFTGV